MYRKKVKKIKERRSFPDTLQAFGFHFNDEGELRNIETGERYAYDIKHGNIEYNQAYYEALSDAVVTYIQERLEKDFGLVQVRLPLDAKDDEPYTVVYRSPDALENPDKLLLLFPGSNIRFGMWARKIVMNDNIHQGSMFDYVRRAQNEGFSVVIMNSNENVMHSNGRRGINFDDRDTNVYIPGSENPELHTATVYENLVKNSKAARICIVGHSWGGHCIVKLMQKYFDDGFKDRVYGISFTDSVHSGGSIESKEVLDWFKERAVNWVTSDRPKGGLIKDRRFACVCASAGHSKHEYTTPSAIDNVFEFFAAMLGEPHGVNPITDGEEEEDEEAEEEEEVGYVTVNADGSQVAGKARISELME